MRITFIGGGNMASAMISGMVENGWESHQILAVDPDSEKRQMLQSNFGIQTSQDIIHACSVADVIVLAVKPQIVSKVAERMSGELDMSSKILISVVAGIAVSTLEKMFGKIPIARSMPNLPAIIREGATGLYFNELTIDIHRDIAQKIISSFGKCITVSDEKLLDAVTAVSGSGPAYYFLLMEAMIEAGVALGLSAQDASELTIQTAIGASKMAIAGSDTPRDLRLRVTSPNGTTHSAISSMLDDNLLKIIKNAMTACRDRAIEIGEESSSVNA